MRSWKRRCKGELPDHQRVPLVLSAIFFLQYFRRRYDFAQNSPGTEQLHPQPDILPLSCRLPGTGTCLSIYLVPHPQAFPDADNFRSLRYVVIDVLLLLIHAAQAVLNNNRELIRKSRIVGYAIGNGRCGQMAMTVFMLQSLSIQRRASGRAAQ